MTRRRKAPLDEVSFQMTPMIDMTFLLLIFFMVTQRITEQELSVPVRLPVALSAASPGKTERDIINLDGEGLKSEVPGFSSAPDLSAGGSKDTDKKNSGICRDGDRGRRDRSHFRSVWRMKIEQGSVEDSTGSGRGKTG